MTTIVSAEGGGTISLGHLRSQNAARAIEWATRDGVKAWSGADWGNEMGGEVGEAQNVIKKLRRLETGYRGPSKGKEDLLSDLADELADVLITADLVAIHYGIDLSDALVRKFNATSVKQGLTTLLGGEPV